MSSSLSCCPRRGCWAGAGCCRWPPCWGASSSSSPSSTSVSCTASRSSTLTLTLVSLDNTIITFQLLYVHVFCETYGSLGKFVLQGVHERIPFCILLKGVKPDCIITIVGEFNAIWLNVVYAHHQQIIVPNELVQPTMEHYSWRI